MAWRLVRTIASTWVRGLCGVPDVPSSRTAPLIEVHNNSKASNLVDQQKIQFIQSQSTPSLTKNFNSSKGSSVSSATTHSAIVLVNSDSKLPLHVDQNYPPPNQLSLLSLKHPVKVTFVLPVHQGTTWEGLIVERNLYLDIPAGVGVERNKEAFVTLLEFAEEQLGCQTVVVCLVKNSPDRAILMRMFMFMGFVLLPPRHVLTPNDAPDSALYLAYSIE